MAKYNRATGALNRFSTSPNELTPRRLGDETGDDAIKATVAKYADFLAVLHKERGNIEKQWQGGDRRGALRRERKGIQDLEVLA